MGGNFSQATIFALGTGFALAIPTSLRLFEEHLVQTIEVIALAAGDFSATAGPDAARIAAWNGVILLPSRDARITEAYPATRASLLLLAFRNRSSSWSWGERGH